MRVFISGLLIILCFSVRAQHSCGSHSYQQQLLGGDPVLRANVAAVEDFIHNNIDRVASRGGGGVVMTIPVVVHILYHLPQENVSDQRVFDQVAALNAYFRRLHADTINTPERFKNVAADCEIEFKLAISDPRRRSTNGIIRKYTPITQWQANDKMKLSAEMGDDAWDTEQYLNIWVVNLRRQAGYATFPGGPAELDGIVLNYGSFGLNAGYGYELGKTAVHEAGHWLGLKHIWGDDFCGNDEVDDTPTQNNFTMGCPTGLRTSCGNNTTGDMYMNFMDVTMDACTNLFTEGQKARMHTLFQPGGRRNKLLTSIGLNPPLIGESPIEEAGPRWLQPRLYPNPASAEITIDISNDVRWVGKTIQLTNFQGQAIMQVVITSRIQTINLGRLAPGVYFLSGKKEDGATIREKFVKL